MISLAQSIDAQQLNQVAPVLFYAFAALSVLSAWAIVLSRNIVRMSVYLLLTLGGVAGLYFMMNAEFLAAIQLIVYAGGTLILIIFGVMLTSKNPFMQLKVKGWEKFVGIGVSIIMILLMLFATAQTTFVETPAEEMATNGPTVRDIGRALITEYLVPFEVAAVLLLVVMIGAAYMARRRA